MEYGSMAGRGRLRRPCITGLYVFVLSFWVSAAVAQVPRLTEIVGGFEHTCALDTRGRVWCWGRNTFGAIGDGTLALRPRPVRVQALPRATQIAVGSGHSCALMENGRVRCWGFNSSGQLGDGSNISSPFPVNVVGLRDVTGIALGGAHSCALRDNGRLRCWGWNFHGQLGNDTNTTSFSPVAVQRLGNVTQVDGGGTHSCALRDNDRIRCWGRNLHGQLGDDTTETRLTSVPVRRANSITQISLGGDHSCALNANGRVRCWGQNAFGQLGNGSIIDRLLPVAVPNVSGASQLALGTSHSCALRSDRTMRCWGHNNQGQLGDGTTTHRNRSVAVRGLGPVASIGLGHWHSCAVLTDGSLRCWGWNNRGQLGDGTTTDRATPVTVSFPAITVSPTQTRLTGPDSGVLGQTVSLTATVTSASGTPAGNVSFRNAGTQFATATLNAQGVATVQTNALPLGTHQITARYLGSASHRASTSAVLPVTIRTAPIGFVGGGAVFGQSDACAPVLGMQAHRVAIRYSPSELGGLPSGLTLAWPEGAEHLTLWGAMAPSGAFLGGSGRQSWSRFVFYPRRPLIRVVTRQVTQPPGAAFSAAQELVLRLRVQNFAARPGCSVTVAGTLRRE